jgi:hypothetical protein
MSNDLAVAAVTETLRDLIGTPVANAVTGAQVGTFSPDDTGNLFKPGNPGVNIFLYQVSPNAALRNADLPTRTHDRPPTLLRKPQAALDLHYLLTYYGDYSVLEPQRLLGAVAKTLHAYPTLSRERIQAVQSLTPFLAASNLDTQTELIRLTPIAFTLEELSKLWSFLLKVDYVLSTAYVASVVLIEEDDKPSAPPPLPVLSYQLAVTAFRQPVITRVVSTPNNAAPIVAGSQIQIQGQNLAAPAGGATQVVIGGVTQAPALIQPTAITLTLSAGLAAGQQTAQVMQPAVLGTPPAPHPGTGAVSGIATFVLSPMIAPGSPPGSFAIGVELGIGSPPETAIVATVIPTGLTGQRVVLQLLPLASPPAGAILLDGGVLTADSATLTFPAPTVPSGQYLAQVLVDGAISALAPGPGGVPTGPLVSL